MSRVRRALIKSKIRKLHGQLVILDVDLAALVGIAPKRLNDLVMRRRPKIPPEFVFPLNGRDAHLVLTEHGVILIAAMLRDPRAVELTIQVVRTFASLCEVPPSNAELTRRVGSLGKAIATLDRETQRHFKILNEALDALEVLPARGIRPHRNLH